MTAPDVREMVAAGRLTTDVETAGALLGLGRTRSFELARTGELPGVRKLGRRYLVSVAELLDFLGVPFPDLCGSHDKRHDAGTVRP